MASERYPWIATYDTDRYLKLIRRSFGHIALPDATRKALLKDIGAVKYHSAEKVVFIRRRKTYRIELCYPLTSASSLLFVTFGGYEALF